MKSSAWVDAIRERDEARSERDEACAWVRLYIEKYRRARIETYLDVKLGNRLRKERDEARQLARRFYKLSRDYEWELDGREGDMKSMADEIGEAKAEIRKLRLLILNSDISDVYYTPVITDDGCGNYALAWCPRCGGNVRPVGVGRFQCVECGE